MASPSLSLLNKLHLKSISFCHGSSAGEAQPFRVKDKTSITVNVRRETLGYPNYRKHRLAQFTCLIKLCALFN